MRQVFYFFLLLFFPVMSLAAQEERMVAFHADVSLDTTGLTAVREQIRIYAAGDIYKRGITRALPLSRRDRDDNRIKITYRVQEVLQDGLPVNFFTEKEDDNLVIYVGERDEFLDPGYYTYELFYETGGQVGFFEDYDELSWNINGTSDKTIDSVSAVVRLPAGADILSHRCYSGVYGSTEGNCFTEIREDGSLFTSAAQLPPGEMLTLSVGFTKGVVTQPPAPKPRKLTWLHRNGLLLISILLMGLLLFYYVFTWRKYGIDPPKPVVIPQFTPPDGLSPAAVGMLHKGHFLDDLITASIVSLSVKGYIRIEEVMEKAGLFGLRRDRRYSLIKLKEDDSTLPPEETIVMRSLFTGSDKITLDGKYNETIADMMRDYRKSMNRQFGSVLSEGQNLKYHLLPWLLMILYVFILIGFAHADLLRFQANKTALYVTLPLLLVSYLVYAWLIVRPGERKLHYRSSIEGLKMYMDVAEEKRLQFFNPPTVTPALFEQLLPYAIALDMEKVWGEKFEKDFLSSTLQPEPYQPVWYTGSYMRAAMLAHVLNSTLSNTVSHAATPPQQSSSGGGNWSSGSFGGGFSGMGGGGGSVGGR